MTAANATIADPTTPEALPHWSVTDVHESLESRTFVASMEQARTSITRLQVLFDEHHIRATDPRAPSPDDGGAADAVIDTYNDTMDQIDRLYAYVTATTAVDSRNEQAQAIASEIDDLQAQVTPLRARLADWVSALGADELAAFSDRAAEHIGPLLRLAQRAARQMSEPEENLYAELSTTGSTAWHRMWADVTSQLTTEVEYLDGRRERLPMPAVRGLAAHGEPGLRKAGYEAELRAWPTVATASAAAMNAVKGEANIVNRRRTWASPLDASLFSNRVSRQTFDAMQAAVIESLDDFRRWMRTKSRLHGHDGPLPWWDLTAPLPTAPASISWSDGVATVKDAFGSYSQRLRALVDRALDERWIDAEPREGKRGGAFCMDFVDDRSLILLNWSGSVDSAQTMAHELGHAYHNTTLAGRTHLQRQPPMALAETASIFCETLVVEDGLSRLSGSERLALLDVDLQAATQVVVDIHSRFLFENEVFARRQHRTLGVKELDELMLQSQAAAYGDGLDQSTAAPYMWVQKPHYYMAHFYNWPYTYGLLFGLGLYARYQDDRDAFRTGYDNLLSRAGMDTAEELGAAFGLDVTDQGFWTASVDVLRERIAQYEKLAEVVAIQ